MDQIGSDNPQDTSFVREQYANAGVSTTLNFPIIPTNAITSLNGLTGPNVTLIGGTSGFSYAPGGTTLTLVGPLTAKGDLYTHDSTNGTRFGVGTDGQVLTADAASTAGLKWVTPGAGVGTVTSVSVVTANGVSGTVANPTTTPAITLTLGAITPSSITIGTVGGSVPADAIRAQGAIYAVSGDKAILLTNNGTTLALNAYDYGAAAGLNVQLGGSGGDIVVKTANLLFDIDNAKDIGVGLARPRTGYFGTSIVVGAGSAITSSGPGGAMGSGAFISSTAGGDLSGTLPSPTVAKINGTSLGTTTATSGNILIGSGTQWATQTVSGDATLSSTGALTLASVITAGGPTGSATVAPIITYDAKGRLTAVSSATITPAVGSVTGLGTGVATALGVNVGTAGAFVVNGGALGSPSSVGTLPAFTLGGTIAGGGNQLNNIIIGTTTPLAGSFTSLAYSTTLTGTSANASALAVGRLGATTPALQVDASTATSITGIKIKSAASGGGVAVSAIGETNVNLTIDASGSGTITVGGTSTGAITLTRATTMSNALTYGGVTLSNAVTGTGNMVLSASPTFTGTLAAATLTATTVNGLTITNNGTNTLSITAGKTVTFLKTMSLTSADDTGVYTLPTGTKTLLATDGAGTSLTGIPYTITGTANQVVASAGTGNITLSLPQSIATSSTPQFARIGLGLAADAVRLIDAEGSVADQNVAAFINTNATNGYGIYIQTASNDTTRNTITALGNTSRLDFKVRSDGAVFMPTISSTSAAQTGTVCWATGGNLTVDTTTTCLLSSAKYKKNARPLDLGLAAVLKLKPVSYHLKKKFNSTGLGEQVGFFAEDVAAIDKRLVSLEEDGSPHAVRYQQLTSVLAAAIQEQHARYELLAARFNTLWNMVNA